MKPSQFLVKKSQLHPSIKGWLQLKPFLDGMRSINDRPDQLNMNYWCQNEMSTGTTPGGCGTSACFGGHVVFAAKAKGKNKKLTALGEINVYRRALQILGNGPEMVMSGLFNHPRWPVEFRRAYRGLEERGLKITGSDGQDGWEVPLPRKSLTPRKLAQLERIERQMADVALRRYKHFLLTGQ